MDVKAFRVRSPRTNVVLTKLRCLDPRRCSCEGAQESKRQPRHKASEWKGKVP